MINPAWSKEPLPVYLSERWNTLRTQTPDSGKISDLVHLGEGILKELSELDAQRRDVKHINSDQFDQRIIHLQEQFVVIIRAIEIENVALMSIEDMQELKRRYNAERLDLQVLTRALEDSIIARGEIFVETYKQNISYHHYLAKQDMLADFIYRMAEIYYQRDAERFSEYNDMSVFKSALEKYQRILDEFPKSDYADAALYNIAYIKSNSPSNDEKQAAIALYKDLAANYPSSQYVPEAYWQLGEYYFYHKPPQVQKAILYYSELQNYTDTRWYARGLYKIGWCHYRNSNYPEAIKYFANTVEVSMQDSETKGDILAASMLEESL